MKANKMPERIYLFDFNDAMVTPLEGDTVYVREDAFIEKACDAYCKVGKMSNCRSNECKFIEDFRKHIKGE